MREDELESECLLRDGTRVRIRRIRPEDARTLQDGFRRLSPASRGRRFGGARTQLSPRDLEALTGADGRRSLALGAVRLDADGWECEGLGVARYTCLPDRSEVAEPGVTVLDGAQGNGLGRLLCEHLIRAAAANGVKTFRTLLVDDHDWLRDRIRRSYPEARLTRRGKLLGAEFPLPPLPPHEPGADAHALAGADARFWDLLRWVAQGAVQPGRMGALRQWAQRLRTRLPGPGLGPTGSAGPPA